MKISYNFTIDDWLHFQRFHIQKSRTYQNIKKLSLFLMPMILIVVFIIQYINETPGLLTTGLFYLVASIIWLFVSSKIYDRSMDKYMKKALNEGDNSSIIGEHTIEFIEDEIHSQTPGTQTIDTWSSIKKIEENEKYFYLYNTAVSAHIIPKSVLGEGKGDILELIESKKAELVDIK